MSTTQDITFSNDTFDLAGQLHLPDGFDRDGSYPAVVISTPGSSVKEQIGANYGRGLADRGYVALAFDPGFQGQSGGHPRDLENPAARVDDIRFAVDYLTTLPYVDNSQIGALGICAGGGYAVSATMTDHRIKALGTVVPVNVGRAFRQADTSSKGSAIAMIDAVGDKRTAAAAGKDIDRNMWIPDTEDQATAFGITDIDTLQAVRFYRTPRGYNENSTNRRYFTSDAMMLGYDAFNLVDELLAQPLQVIVGGRLGTTFSYSDGLALWEKAPNAKNFHVIDGAGHYEMYDEPEYVNEAVETLDVFFREHLAS
ncbi:alpha/beta hydrolase [Frigoribacterium sp. MCBA15_019]|uniref:alpha/beta hydrolase n=1 Tax=Frigoribacterium sp. MCBA15_019 TaxID=1898745 RepID=UPI0008DDB584|nr:alpha/beta hydrolase [Frigoribacterium sp. MCBA15_019]OII27330.1 dienelactone hydrolase [Frigoribacterium sp. MCBA15_019]